MSAVVADGFDRATRHGFLAGGQLGLTFRLFADVRVRVFERPDEIQGRGIAAHIAVDAGRIDVERSVNVVFDFVVWIGHESADYTEQ